MNPSHQFLAFAQRLRDYITRPTPEQLRGSSFEVDEFNDLALTLYRLQFEHNLPYKRFCESLGRCPASTKHWIEIPSLPAAAFKELELFCLPADQVSHVFLSSGTTATQRGRHLHNADSLSLYELSLLRWFEACLPLDAVARKPMLFLTPDSKAAPASSLSHMFDTIRTKFGAAGSFFAGLVDKEQGWTVELDAAVDWLAKASRGVEPVLVFGTAFSFVHLLDELARRDLKLPPGSGAMETGGYKGRSRSLPRQELHELISKYLGISLNQIVCEYGMTELSSQAYDVFTNEAAERRFRFPPWARLQIVSPETGLEATEGEIGLIRVFDLANVFSVMAIQTEDLGKRRSDGFELIGRAEQAEVRGCSLMSVEHR